MVGTVCCRVENIGLSTCRLYIMAFGCLSSYRRLGIGSRMIEHIFEYVSNSKFQINSIYLHVQTDNHEAIEFYRRFGFEIVETIRNYYRRLNPPDAYVLCKSLNS